MYGEKRHVIGVHVAQQPENLFWATAEHEAMIEEWKPRETIDLTPDDDETSASPAAGSSSVGSSSQDADRQKRSRNQTNRTAASYSTFQGKGKGKGKREASPPKSARAGASSKRARKSAVSDAALDTKMEEYQEKQVAYLKKIYDRLINEHNHQRIANIQLISKAATAGEFCFTSSHSPVLYSLT